MRRSFLFTWAIILMLLAGIQPRPAAHSPENLNPMPPHPSLVEKLRREGRALPNLSSRYSRGVDVPQRMLVPPTGNFKLLVVAVQFSDNPGMVTPTFFDNLVFAAPGPGVNSVRDYFDEVSGSTLTLATVNLPGSLGWVSGLPRPYNGPAGYINADGLTGTPDDYGWGAFPQNLQGIVWDVIPLLDPLIDFSQYDNNSDGFVDGLLVVHAGAGAEITGSTNDIWSSSWNLTSSGGPGVAWTGEGVYVDNFAFVPEYMTTVSPGASDQTIGVFCHELGHNLFGLPDLYDTDGSSAGAGDWSLMSTGSWNGPGFNGSSPAWPDAWSRMLMGFVSPTEITLNFTNNLISPVEQYDTVYKLASPYLTDGEYFLVENRQPMGYDAFLPGRGLLIWHVDEEKWNLWEGNDNECKLYPSCQCPSWHYLVSLEQADGLLQLENNVNTGDTGDPFPPGATGNANFAFGTNPESGSWQPASCPTNSCIAVKNVHVFNAGPPDTIMADFEVVCVSASACVNVTTPPIGWGEAGAQYGHVITLENCGGYNYFALSFSGGWPGYTYNPSNGQPISSLVMFSGSRGQVGVRVTIPESAAPGMAQAGILTLTPQWTPGPPVSTVVDTRVPACVLLVDDDRGLPNFELRYMMALTNGNFTFDYWDMTLQGSPDSRTLAAHRAIIWFTGAYQVDTLRPREEMGLASYLDGGGRLFLSSQDYLWDAGRTFFNRVYLRMRAYIDNIGASGVHGIVGNPVGQGMGPFTFIQPEPRADGATALFPATVAFQSNAGIDNALTFDSGTWRTLFLAWPFEALAPPDADLMMQSAMSWFGVQTQPTAGFAASDNMVCVGDVVTFTNTSSGANEYWWEFGDGWTNTMTDTTHVYNWPLTATVSLRSANCCGYDFAFDQVVVSNAPQASFSASDDILLVGQTITFTSIVTDVTRVEWDFGDGITSTLPNPTHVYTAPLETDVILTASNGCGSTQASHPIAVYNLVVAGFEMSEDVALVGEIVVFTNTSQNATSYLWDFGDGVTSTLTHPTHVYTAPISANITLTASNGYGPDQASYPITVYAPTVAGFEVNATAVAVGETVIFTNTSQNANTFVWNFGDGVGTSTETHPSYDYASPGVYTVTLQVSNPASQDSAALVIHVTETGSQQTIYLPLVVRDPVGKPASPENGIQPPASPRIPGRR